MDNVARLERFKRFEQMGVQGPLKSHLIADNMKNGDTESQRLKVVFVFEAAIRRHENVALELFYQYVVFEVLPPQIENGLDLVSHERFHDAGGRIYNDARANWSIAISRVSSRNEKT